MRLRFETLVRLAGALAVASAIAGCTSGNSAIEPPFQSNDIATQGKLQFVVGTANIANGASSYVGLNTVVTFRQSNGLSAFALDQPAISGPSGFLVPASATSAGSDAGTATIGAGTFGAAGQATLYGFGPNNYDTSGSANFGTFALPVYCEVLGTDPTTGGCSFPAVPFGGLPPAFPASQIAGFTGYNPGFVDFAAPAVSGAYALAVTVPTSPGSSQASYTYHATTTLDAAKVLPPLAAPSFADDGKGGGTVAVTAFPAGVVSELVEVSDGTSGSPLGTFDFSAPGAQALPDGTLASGSPYVLSAVGFDYNWFAAAAPANVRQLPALPAQADITVAPPATLTAASIGRHPLVHPRSANGKRSSSQT